MFQIGTSLREARLRQGLDLVDAEAATKIRPKYIQALEEERFELLPSPTYVKGFLRSYADYLGLDGQLYVDEHNSRYVAGDDELASRARRSAAETRAHRRVESSALVLALAGIATATALVFLAWKWGGDSPQVLPNTTPPPAKQTPRARPGPATTSKARRPWISLELTAARGSSFVTVRRGSARGKPIFSGTIERRRKMTFVGPRVWFDAARPGVLVARVNEHRVRIPADPSEPAALIATRRGIFPTS